MPLIGEFLKKEVGSPKFQSERAETINQIYNFYTASTKKENIKKYYKWLGKEQSSSLKVQEFKKTTLHLKTRAIKSFCIMLAHIPTEDLYYILSVAKDKHNRKENFSGWLMGEVYKKG